MKRILTILLVALSLAAYGQGAQDKRQALEQYVEKTNAACPTAMLGIVTQTSVTLQGNDLTYTWKIADDAAYAQIKEKQSLMRDAKIAELSTSGDSDELLKFMEMLGVNLVFHMENNDGTDSFDMIITKADLQ